MKVILSLLLLFLPFNALAEKGLWSKGHLSCGKFLTACNKSQYNIDCQAQTFYAMGFVSGATLGSKVLIRKFDTASIKYALIKFCENKPLKDTNDGSIDIVKQLR